MQGGSSNLDGLRWNHLAFYDPAMPALAFWLLVIAVVVFMQLTTKAERRALVENFWVAIVLLGAFGFIWQFLRQGTLSS